MTAPGSNVNYYNHHIGDYAKDTAHLSMVEDGAYRRLIDICYATERPLPHEARAIYRLVRALSKPEREAVDAVLADFFEKKNDGWHQKRCDEEIAFATEKSQKARDSAGKRWHGRNDANADANASKNAMRTHSEGNAPSTSSTPIASTPSTNKIQKQSSADFKHPTRSETDRAPPEKKKQEPGDPGLALHVAMAVKLRELGVTVSAVHPQVHDWIREGVTLAMALEAVAIARMRKPEGTIAPRYLAAIVADMLDKKSINGFPLRSSSEWWQTDTGLQAKAKELGIFYEDDPNYSPTENKEIFKATVFLAAGEGPWIDPRDSTMRRIMDQIRHSRAA